MRTLMLGSAIVGLTLGLAACAQPQPQFPDTREGHWSACLYAGGSQEGCRKVWANRVLEPRPAYVPEPQTDTAANVALIGMGLSMMGSGYSQPAFQPPPMAQPQSCRVARVGMSTVLQCF